MSAAGNFNAVPRKDVDIVEPAPVAEPHEPFDLAQAQAAVWALVGAVLYLFFVVATAITLTMAFAAWVGCLVGLVFACLPAGYSLVKAHQAVAERERRAHEAKFRGDQAGPTGFNVPLPTRP